MSETVELVGVGVLFGAPLPGLCLAVFLRWRYNRKHGLDL